MSAFCKPRYKIDYSQHQFIKRSVMSPAIRSTFFSPRIHTYLSKHSGSKDPLNEENITLSTQKRTGKNKDIILKVKHNSTSSMKSNDTTNSNNKSKAKYYKQKVIELTKVLEERSTELNELRKQNKDKLNSNFRGFNTERFISSEASNRNTNTKRFKSHTEQSLIKYLNPRTDLQIGCSSELTLVKEKLVKKLETAKMIITKLMIKIKSVDPNFKFSNIYL